MFVTRIEGNKTINEGLCLKCAKELGVKPVTDIIEKMGINEEDLDAMMDEVSALMPTDDEENADDDDSGRAPAINFGSIFPRMQGGQRIRRNPKGSILANFVRTLPQRQEKASWTRLLAEIKSWAELCRYFVAAKRTTPVL